LLKRDLSYKIKIFSREVKRFFIERKTVNKGKGDPDEI
jgi:hypothetical protein